MGQARKIGVLTFHRCINYGSYWQARCLVTGLRARGYDAVLLDYTCREATRAEWRCALQPLLPERSPPCDARSYADKTRKFLAAIDEIPREQAFELGDPASMPDYDLVLVGSDEVWNFNHPWYGGRSIFFGNGLRARRLASYGASFGSYSASAGLNDYWSALLRRFTALSVRDENSRSLIRNALARNPALVLDPCLQFPLQVPTNGARPQKPYVALYGHSFPTWFVDRLCSWASRTDHRIVSIGYRNPCADEQCIAASPEDFASLLSHAAAVATNFFHGCIFALLNARPFACVRSPYRLNKIRDLTVLLGASHHLVDERTSAATFSHLLSHAPDDAISAKIESIRTTSNSYLDRILCA